VCWQVVFGGFAAKELAKRIDDAQPKALVATSCGVEPKGVIDYKRPSSSSCI
jgi:propionyl-CoA synthetase